jgi:hypothetical protein
MILYIYSIIVYIIYQYLVTFFVFKIFYLQNDAIPSIFHSPIRDAGPP